MGKGSLLPHALEYIRRGFPVIPVRVADKKPLVSWKEFQRRLPTEEEVQGWFSDADPSSTAIGIVTGKVSGLAVVDLDTEEAVKFAKSAGFPTTPVVKTGKGFHRYYAYRPDLRNFQTRSDLPGIDLRAEGGYVLAPPSVHPSGKQYRWVTGKSLDDLSLAEGPWDVLFHDPETDKMQQKPLKDLYSGIAEGGRNSSLARLVGSWTRDGLTLEECLASAGAVNAKYNPPLSQQEVERIVSSIMNTHTRNHPCKEHEPEGKKVKPTQLDGLLEVASKLEVFHDDNRDAYCILNGQCVSLRGKEIKNYLSYEAYNATKRTVNSNSLSDVLTMLNGKAMFEGPERKLHNRIASGSGAFWFDIGDHRAIRTTADRWEIVEAPIMFRRYGHQSIQVMPKSGGDIWLLFDFINVKESDRLITIVLLISYLVPDIPHPIFHPHGAQGGGKTSLFRAVKRLIDPSTLEAMITPKDKNELIRQIARHHVPLFDNLSKLDSEMSDIICLACTGGGISKRQLFTDDEDHIYNFKRCIGINGINLLITKPDLLDRTILLRLERIVPEKRREETELWQEFDQAKPGILGGMFDVLSRAMRLYPQVRLTDLPRLADFARWGYAIAEAIGEGLGKEFMDAYAENIKRQNSEVIQNNTLCDAVIRFMDGQSEWEGTISAAFSKLLEIAKPEKSDRSFPKDAKNLRKHLERVQATLMDAEGITYNIGDRTSQGYPIVFKKGPGGSKRTSSASSCSGSPSDLVSGNEAGCVQSVAASYLGSSESCCEINGMMVNEVDERDWLPF